MEEQTVDNNYWHIKRLAIAELVLSCLILIFGIISTCLGGKIDDLPVAVCNLGTSIWAPIIGIITAGLGLSALKYDNYNRKCLLLSHFVMCIISAIDSGVLITLSCMCWTISLRLNGGGWFFQQGLTEAFFTFEASIIIGAVTHIIVSIVSTTFICRYWYVGGWRGTLTGWLEGKAGHRINSTQLTLVQKLGQGQFGEVWQSRYTDHSGKTMDVAAKISKHHLNANPDLTLASANCFFQESLAFDFLRHANITNVLGICSNLKMAGGITTPALVLEYMDGGNSADYVLLEREHLLTSDLMRIFIDICKAGEHLQKMGVIHRDIGARNVLIRKHPTNGKPAVAKLTDFGLAKDVGKAGHYTSTDSDRTMFNERYTAPEGFSIGGKLSSQSDVWSFGVFMWEVYMLMDRNQTEPVLPYSEISQDLQGNIKNGYRLGQPLKTSNDIFTTMTACWTWTPESRPTFVQLHKTLKAMLTNNGIRAQDVEVGSLSARSMLQLANMDSFGGADLLETASSEQHLPALAPYGRPS